MKRAILSVFMVATAAILQAEPPMYSLIVFGDRFGAEFFDPDIEE